MKEPTRILMAAVLGMALAGSAAAQGTTQESSSSSARSGTAAHSSATDTKEWERQHRASKIIGTDVYDMQGKKIGSVRDVVIDPQSGNINYAVVSFGGVMGVGGKYFAVPWKSLQATNDAKNYALNVDREALKSAPGFDKDRWPDMANQQWASDVERYWQSRQSSGSSESPRESSSKPAR